MINFIKNNNKISNTYTNEIFEIYKLQYINLSKNYYTIYIK
jgi:hypothetical protein